MNFYIRCTFKWTFRVIGLRKNTESAQFFFQVVNSEKLEYMRLQENIEQTSKFCRLAEISEPRPAIFAGRLK
jgi:hypothetical protein